MLRVGLASYSRMCAPPRTDGKRAITVVTLGVVWVFDGVRRRIIALASPDPYDSDPYDSMTIGGTPVPEITRGLMVYWRLSVFGSLGWSMHSHVQRGNEKKEITIQYQHFLCV